MSGKVEKSRLEVLATEINTEHGKFRSAFKATYQHAIRVGVLLSEAKAEVEHGDWGAWVADNCEFSMRTAQVYMRLANNRALVEKMLKNAESAHLSIEGVLKAIAAPETTEDEPAVEIETTTTASGTVTSERLPDGRIRTTVEHWRSPAAPRKNARPLSLEELEDRVGDGDLREFYARSYREREKQEGTKAAKQWLGNMLRDREEFEVARQQRRYESLTSKAEFVANELWELLTATTARFEDIPEENPLPEVLDPFDWRQVLAILEDKQDELAADGIDRYARSGKGTSFDMRRELGYVLKYNEYADIGRLEEDIKLLRAAGQNFAALANSLDKAMKERTDG